MYPVECRNKLGSIHTAQNYTSMKINELPINACMCTKLLPSYPTLCDPMDCSLPVSSVHGISQPRILEWVAMPSSRGSSRPRDRTRISCIGGRFFTAKLPEAPPLNATRVNQHIEHKASHTKVQKYDPKFPKFKTK